MSKLKEVAAIYAQGFKTALRDPFWYVIVVATVWVNYRTPGVAVAMALVFALLLPFFEPTRAARVGEILVSKKPNNVVSIDGDEEDLTTVYVAVRVRAPASRNSIKYFGSLGEIPDSGWAVIGSQDITNNMKVVEDEFGGYCFKEDYLEIMNAHLAEGETE